ncbi:hypothetical protein MYAM1_000341 [Malassezia yamatoensis]|uniref:Transcriptional regulatory protein RXT2 N-terminal domain-containing protein n=1 Tax=Malassezia yamatoensis TaxID=253288 RepID=A0AAJ5YNM2_9BASI|nr:hypothetical protein MYAM1_000341 [Malassezia yamatoensis]
MSDDAGTSSHAIPFETQHDLPSDGDREPLIEGESHENNINAHRPHTELNAMHDSTFSNEMHHTSNAIAQDQTEPDLFDRPDDTIASENPGGDQQQNSRPNSPDVQHEIWQQEMNKLMWLSLPGNDQVAYYSDSNDADSDYSAIQAGPSQYSNRNRKLYAKNDMRWIHRGKLGNWTEARMECEMQQREERRLDAFQHASVEALLETETRMPGSHGSIFRDPPRKKRRKTAVGTNPRSKLPTVNGTVENDLLGDDTDEEERISLSASTLAPSLLLPALNTHDLLRSKLLKQIFNNKHITSLSRTALDLRESEHDMAHALGRCFGAMERIFDSDPRETKDNADAPGTLRRHKSLIPGKSSQLKSPSLANQDEEGLRISSKMPSDEQRSHAGTPSKEQSEELVPNHHPSHDIADQPDEASAKKETSSTMPMDDSPPLAQIKNLFLTKGALTIPASSLSEDEPPSSLSFAEEEQHEIVNASLACLNDLYTDSLGYMERLDEIRSLLADIEWHRSHIWNILRTWATKRDNEEHQAVQTSRLAQIHSRNACKEVPADFYDPSVGYSKGAEINAPNSGHHPNGEYTNLSTRGRARRKAGR